MTVSLIEMGSEPLLLSANGLKIPLYVESVQAGFPSPAQDYVDQNLDLNQLCIAHPAATYFVRVTGDSMVDAGIYPDDILVVDRSIQAKHGDIVIASVLNELTVKKLHLRPAVYLIPCNKNYKPIHIPEGNDLEIFGVVTFAVRSIRG